MSGPPQGGQRVTLTATDADVEDPAQVAAQLPAPSGLDAGTTVIVEAVAVQRRRLLRPLLGDKRVPVSKAVRCTALLARGYVDIAAEGDAVWARAIS